MAVFILKTNDVSGRTRAKIFQSVSVNASLSSSRLKTGIRCGIMRREALYTLMRLQRRIKNIRLNV